MVNDVYAEYSDETEGENEFVFSPTNTPGIKSPTVTIQLIDTPTTFIIDTGATINILDFQTYKNLHSKPKLNGPSPQIFAYGAKTPLAVKGFFTSIINYKDNQTKATFYVVDNSSGNLLSRTTAQNLNVIQYAFTTNISAEIASEFKTLFDDTTGKIENITVKLHVGETVKPIAQRHRRIPFHIREDVEQEVERLEKLDIIEKVEGPTPWVSPTVIVPKKNGAIRICADMPEANKAIKRERHPMPTIR